MEQAKGNSGRLKKVVAVKLYILDWRIPPMKTIKLPSSKASELARIFGLDGLDIKDIIEFRVHIFDDGDISLAIRYKGSDLIPLEMTSVIKSRDKILSELKKYLL